MLVEPTQDVEEGHGARVDHSLTAPSTSDLCDELMNLQAIRRYCIKLQDQMNKRIQALVRWQFGYTTMLPEKDRNRICKRADAFLSALQQGEPTHPDDAEHVESLTPFVQDHAISIAPQDERRKVVEAAMQRLVKDLPAYEFSKSVRGLGDLGFAVIVGSAGDLSNYPNWQHLWKRLGWAPRECYPKGEKSEGHMIPKQTKGQIYGSVVQPMMKQQLRSVKLDDGKPTGETVPIGPYGEIYLERKAQYLARFTADGSKTPKLHAHKLAMRVMLKQLLKDLWLAWNDQTPPCKPAGA